MTDLLKHPLALMIAGSIITYFLIPELQASNIEKKSIQGYETKLVCTNNEMASELNDMLDLFENFAWEVGNDTTITEPEILAIQNEYRDKTLSIDSKINTRYYQIQSLRSELFLHYSFDELEKKELLKLFKLLTSTMETSTQENKKLLRNCFYDRNFKYTNEVAKQIKKNRAYLKTRLGIQHQQLEKVFKVLND